MISILPAENHHILAKDSRLLDPKVKTYLPAVGGLTIYTFGDARKLKDEKTEVRRADAELSWAKLT